MAPSVISGERCQGVGKRCRIGPANAAKEGGERAGRKARCRTARRPRKRARQRLSRGQNIGGRDETKSAVGEALSVVARAKAACKQEGRGGERTG